MHSVKNILSSPVAAPLVQRLALHQKLLDAVNTVLPFELRDKCLACWIDRRNQLVLQVSGQEYAAQIRFYQVALASAARGVLGAEVQKVVMRALIPTVPSVVPVTQIAPGAAKLLAEEAAACNVPEISVALGRLAGTLANRSGARVLQ